MTTDDLPPKFAFWLAASSFAVMLLCAGFIGFLLSIPLPDGFMGGVVVMLVLSLFLAQFASAVSCVIFTGTGFIRAFEKWNPTEKGEAET